LNNGASPQARALSTQLNEAIRRKFFVDGLLQWRMLQSWVV
jgi:hypothetical protein